MYFCRIINHSNMKRRNLLFAAVFAMAMFAGLSVKAQDSVFSYAYHGTTLYYIIDSTQQARVVPPLYPNMYYYPDNTDSSSWYGYTQPKGTVVVPDTVVFNGGHYPVTALEAFAFFRCDSVTSVTLPVSVTYLEHDAFTECSLETISMPGVTFMGEGCFYKASSLTSLDIPAGVTSIPDWCCDYGYSLHSVTFHEGLITIGKSAFLRCQSLQSVTFPESLDTIGPHAFGSCHSLVSVTFPDSLSTIEASAFTNCTSLLTITLPDGLTTIQAFTFFNCTGLQSVSFPVGLTSIGAEAFKNCSSLQSITFPESLTTIETCTFYECTGLQSVSFPDGLTTLGYYAFCGCSNLQSVDIPGSVSVIGEWAFSYCKSLTNVTLHEGTDTIGNVAFYECSSLTTINYPSTLKKIGEFAFMSDSLLTSPVILPYGLTHLGEAAFARCINIVSVSLPGTLSEFLSFVFANCTALETVTIGDGITEIPAHTFHLCPNIDTFFVNCAVPPTVGSLSDSTFYTYNSTVVVPCGSEEDYRQDLAWGLFSDITEDCGVGIHDVYLPEINIRVENNRIEVEGVEGENVRVFDITGRVVRNETLSAGVYLVQIGNRPARKVLVHPNM